MVTNSHTYLKKSAAESIKALILLPTGIKGLIDTAFWVAALIRERHVVEGIAYSYLSFKCKALIRGRRLGHSHIKGNAVWCKKTASAIKAKISSYFVKWLLN